MKLSELKEGYKIDVISMDRDLFDKSNVYTDYSILKYKGKLYIKYVWITSQGEQKVSCLKVTNINSVIEEDGKEIINPHSVDIGCNLKGEYSNGYHFNIPSMLSIKVGIISYEDKVHCKEVAI